jgi:hypothetical protein
VLHLKKNEFGGTEEDSQSHGREMKENEDEDRQ